MQVEDIEFKEDSAEKLAAIAGKPTKNFIFGPEINAIKERLLQTALGKRISYIGTDSVIETSDKTKILVCNNDDFYSIFKDNVFLEADELKFLNITNTNRPALVITEELTVIHLEGQSFVQGDAVEFKQNSFLTLLCIAENEFYAEYSNASTIIAQTIQDVLLNGNVVNGQLPVIFQPYGSNSYQNIISGDYFAAKNNAENRASYLTFDGVSFGTADESTVYKMFLEGLPLTTQNVQLILPLTNNPEERIAYQSYVDALQDLSNWKNAVKIAFTNNLPISGSFPYITNLNQQGVLLNEYDFVLVAGQTDATKNRIGRVLPLSSGQYRISLHSTYAGSSKINNAIVLVTHGTWQTHIFHQKTLNPNYSGSLFTDNIIFEDITQKLLDDSNDYTNSQLSNKADLVSGIHTAAQSRQSNLSYNSTTGVITLTDATGTTHQIDLPIENLFQNASYNSSTQQLILTTNGGGTIAVDLATLVDLPEIVVSASSNPVTTPSSGQRMFLRADNGSYWIASAGTWNGPFLGVTSAEKTTWNGKQNALGFTAENTAKKTATISESESDTSLFGTIVGWLTFLKDRLSYLIAVKTTALIDADRIVVFDSTDAKTKTRTFAEIKTTLASFFTSQSSWTDYSSSAIFSGWTAGSFTKQKVLIKETSANSIKVYFSALATSNNTGKTITIDRNASESVDQICKVVNNGSVSSTGLVRTTAGSNVITFFASAAAGNWTASNSASVESLIDIKV